MLKKSQRLSSNFEFNITKKYGSKINGQLFTLLFLKPRNYTGPAKVGFIISNKVDKRSTKRNRLKRLFREAFRKNSGLLPADVWIVVIPRGSGLTKTYEEIYADVNKTLSEISFS